MKFTIFCLILVLNLWSSINCAKILSEGLLREQSLSYDDIGNPIADKGKGLRRITPMPEMYMGTLEPVDPVHWTPDQPISMGITFPPEKTDEDYKTMRTPGEWDDKFMLPSPKPKADYPDYQGASGLGQTYPPSNIKEVRRSNAVLRDLVYPSTFQPALTPTRIWEEFDLSTIAPTKEQIEEHRRLRKAEMKAIREQMAREEEPIRYVTMGPMGEGEEPVAAESGLNDAPVAPVAPVAGSGKGPVAPVAAPAKQHKKKSKKNKKAKAAVAAPA